MLDDLPLLMAEAGAPTTLGGVTISGIRDRRPRRLWEDQAPLGAVDVSVLCRTADLPPLTEGMPVAHDGTAYVLAFHEPDNDTLDGLWTRLYLETP